MKSLTIAFSTAKEAVRQPSFLILMVIALLWLSISIFLPYFTFGEEIKMYKDTGLTTISFVCLLLTLLTSSSTVADEIEGKTAVTVLSKPIDRREFIVGKFLGILMGVGALYVILGLAFAAGVWFKIGYDMFESQAGRMVETSERLAQVRQVLPGLVLGFLEVTTLAAISLAISTRLPMLVNLVICFSIFFLGHLAPVLVQVTSGAGANELIKFMAQLFAWILPSLEFFNASPAISTGAVIPWAGYVLPALVYCVMYSGAALLLAFLLFEDRDLA